MTGEREIRRVVITTVLLGHDVLDVKRKESSRFLRDQAILAPIAGAPADEVARVGVHATTDAGLETCEPSIGKHR